MKTSNKIQILVECALMVALAAVLALLPVIRLPYGGSVSWASMAPIVLISFRHGPKWGLLSGIAFALIQMMQAFYPPPTQTALNFALVVLLDYLLAFGVLGIACLFGRRIQKPALSMAVGAFCVTCLRYLCHIVSGVLIWGVYAEEGQSVLVYSILYNGTYMIPEIIITTVVCALLGKLVLPKLKKV